MRKLSTLKHVKIQDVLDAVEKLPLDDQETLVEIVKKRIVERRRDEIAHNARQTLKAVRDKKARYGDIDDLKKDLLGDE